MANQSKYTFAEVEGKLDIIKNDQCANKVLLGDGTYGSFPSGSDGVGIANIAKTSSNDLVDTYTITLTDGNTTTFEVTNGASVTVTENASNSDTVYKLDITTKDGTITTPNLKGGGGSGDTSVLDDAVISLSTTYSSSKIESDFAKSDDVTTALADKVDVIAGMGLSTNDYTTDEKTKLASLDNYDDTAISDRVAAIENDYANKTYVGEQIANAGHLKKMIVTTLPLDTDAEEDIIYMVKDDTVTGDDKYKEYMKIDGVVTPIGSTSVDLIDYYNKTETDTLLADKANSVDVYAKTETYSQTEVDDLLSAFSGGDVDLTGYYKKTETYSQSEVDTLLDEKVNSTDVYSKTETDTLLTSKVNAVDGLGLSRESYTTEEKTKLAGLENYDDTSISDRLSTVEGSYEKVKLNSVTDAKYLSELIDNSTIEADEINNCLVVKKIYGQNVTVTEINFLTGVTSNIQEQINNLGKPMTMYGVFGTKAELIASTDPAPTDGNTAIVIADEEHDNKQMTYIYIASTSTWTPVTESSIRVRDLSTEPVDLSTETTGTLPKGKIDAAIARLADVLDKSTYRGTGDGIVKKADTLTGLTATISQLNQVISDSHTHANKAMLDKIVSNGVGSGFLADNGEYIEFLHIGTTSPAYEVQIWLDNTDSTKPILKIYDGTNWINAVDLSDYAKKSEVPVLTDLIDDVTSSGNTTYSSNQIETKLSGYAETTDVNASLDTKVDKVSGKGLSTNDITDTLKAGYDDAVTKAHVHENKTVLDKLSEDTSGMPLYNGDKFYDGLIANNLTTTDEGYALDARQGNALDSRVSELETPEFTQASTRSNIASQESMPTILGKIMKYFSDLKSHAFNSLANNLTTTSSGSYALDAYQGKVLNDKINSLIGMAQGTIPSTVNTRGYVDMPSGFTLDNSIVVGCRFGSAYTLDYLSGSGIISIFWETSNPINRISFMPAVDAILGKTIYIYFMKTSI